MTKPDDMQPHTTSSDDADEPMGAGMMAHQDPDMMSPSGQHPDMMTEPHADGATMDMPRPNGMTGDPN